MCSSIFLILEICGLARSASDDEKLTSPKTVFVVGHRPLSIVVSGDAHVLVRMVPKNGGTVSLLLSIDIASRRLKIGDLLMAFRVILAWLDLNGVSRCGSTLGLLISPDSLDVNLQPLDGNVEKLRLTSSGFCDVDVG